MKKIRLIAAIVVICFVNHRHKFAKDEYIESDYF